MKKRDRFIVELLKAIEKIEEDEIEEVDISYSCKNLCSVLKKYHMCENCATAFHDDPDVFAL